MDDDERREAIRTRFAKLTAVFEDMAGDAVAGQGALSVAAIAVLTASLVERCEEARMLLDAIAGLAARP